MGLNTNSGGTVEPPLRSVSQNTDKFHQHPRVDLKPRRKGSQDGVSNIALFRFSTKLGTRRIPRQRYPLRPTPNMIQSARHGILTKFLQNGNAIKASYLQLTINPKTAKTNLIDNITMETDYLSEEEEQMTEELRTNDNLYYLSVEQDELPSYRFWKTKNDPDPMIGQRLVNYAETFRNTKLLPEEAAALAEFERERADIEVRSKEELESKSIAQNAWTEFGDGQHYRGSNLKRDSELRFWNPVKATIGPHWKSQRKLLGIPYSSNDQPHRERSGQFGPRPGDAEWELVEASWEQKLEKYGFADILKALSEQNSRKFSELRYGTTSSIVRLARGDDEYAQKFNDELKTSIPTVAFKLTQQHFGRPVSPINFQEPLVRGQNPGGWDLQGDQAVGIDDVYEIIKHEEDELEFLDFYNKESYGEPILRRRKPIPEEYIHQLSPPRNLWFPGVGNLYSDGATKELEPINFGPGLRNDFFEFEDYELEEGTISAYHILGKTCCLYVDNWSYESFYNAAYKVAAWDSAPVTLKEFSFAVETPGANEYNIEVGSSEPENFSDILLEIGNPKARIRVARTKEDLRFIPEPIKTNFLEVRAPEIGHFVTSLRWDKRKEEFESLSFEFLDSAIRFLFPQPKKSEIMAQTLLLEIPGHGDHVICLDDPLVLNETIQGIFSSITGLETDQVLSNHAHVELYKRTDIFLDPPRAPLVYTITRPARTTSSLFSPPFNFQCLMDTIRNSLYSHLTSAVILIPNLKDLEAGRHSPLFREPSFEERGDQLIEVSPQKPLWKDSWEVIATQNVWANYMAKNITVNEPICVIKPFEKIRVYDGTGFSALNGDWVVSKHYERNAFNIEGLMKDLALLSSSLLGFDPRVEGPGIKIRVPTFKSDSEWLYFNHVTSSREFLQKVFLKIDNEHIEICPGDWRDRIRATFDFKKSFRDMVESQEILARSEQGLYQGVNETRRQLELDRQAKPKRSDDSFGPLSLPGIEAERQRQAARTEQESVYRNPGGNIKLPRWGPCLEPEMRGGPDFPTLYPRVLTIAETEGLQQRLRLRENFTLEREEAVSREISQRPKEMSTCPACDQIWTFATKEERLAHLTQKHMKHPPRCPYCKITWLGATKREQAHHLEHWHKIQSNPPLEGICPVLHCYAALYLMNSDFRDEHEEMHRRADLIQARSVPEVVSQGTQTKGLPPPPGSTASRPIILLGPGEDPIDNSQRRTKGGPIDNLQPSPGAKYADNLRPGKGRERVDLSEIEPAPLARPVRSKDEHYYCPICWRDLLKLSEKVQITHCQKCGITVDQMLTLHPQDVEAVREAQETGTKKIDVGKSPKQKILAKVTRIGMQNNDEPSEPAAGPKRMSMGSPSVNARKKRRHS